MLVPRFEESEKRIKKAKASGANKQLGGDAGSCWCLETAVVCCQCGGKRDWLRIQMHRNNQMASFDVCAHVQRALQFQLGDQADVI